MKLLVLVVLGGADAQDCAEKSADDRDGRGNFGGIGELPNLTQTRVECADSREDDDCQIL